MIQARLLCILLSAALLLGSGCQRAADPRNAQAPAGKREPASLAGQIVLSGELGRARTGSVIVRVWPAGEPPVAGALPFLSRSYPLDDPDWSTCAGGRRRYFGLCDADRVGDPARVLPAELEIEACYDPDAPPGAGEGLVRATARARNGAKDIQITVAPQVETAQPPGGRKQGG